MSRWIDADALMSEFPHDEDWDYPVNTNSYVVEVINSAPSIDIVRCKECKVREDCPLRLIANLEYCSIGEREVK